MMDNKIQIISQTTNGKIYKCSKCANIHMEYKNLYFKFSQKEYLSFKEFFFTIDGEYWEKRNKGCFSKRKIMIPISHRNFMIALNSIEVYELKALFTDEKSGEKRFKLTNLSVFENISVN